MASALWGGGLLTLCIEGLQAALKLSERRRLVGDVARRFSILAGVALFMVLLTGFDNNAWLPVGTIRAMWKTPYGQTLLVKFLLVFPVLALGASNHHISVPLLQRRAERPLPIPLPLALSPVMLRLLTGRLGHRKSAWPSNSSEKCWLKLSLSWGSCSARLFCSMAHPRDTLCTTSTALLIPRCHHERSGR
jgi:Copper resistance protein D